MVLVYLCHSQVGRGGVDRAFSSDALGLWFEPHSNSKNIISLPRSPRGFPRSWAHPPDIWIELKGRGQTKKKSIPNEMMRICRGHEWWLLLRKPSLYQCLILVLQCIFTFPWNYFRPNERLIAHVRCTASSYLRLFFTDFAATSTTDFPKPWV